MAARIFFTELYKWPKGKVNALGFWFSSDSNITVSHNYIDNLSGKSESDVKLLEIS